MNGLLKNKSIILLVVLIILVVIFKQTKEPSKPMTITAKQADNKTERTKPKQTTNSPAINFNPQKISQIKNPFRPLNEILTATDKSTNTVLNLLGIVSQDNESLAIISNSGKSDFYKLNQKIMEYVLVEINSTSVVLYNEQKKQYLTIHIKE